MQLALCEYLSTHYRPDCEYIDGYLVERNVGELDHSWLLRETLLSFRDDREHDILALPSLRVRVSPSRVRVPDVVVVRGDPREQVLTRPPLICIEVLSVNDSMSFTLERIDDYLTFGVENIWIVDPSRRKAFWADETGIHESLDGILLTTKAPIHMDLAPMWPTNSSA